MMRNERCNNTLYYNGLKCVVGRRFRQIYFSAAMVNLAKEVLRLRYGSVETDGSCFPRYMQ